MSEFLYRERVQYEHRNGENLMPTMAGTYNLWQGDEYYRAVLDITPDHPVLRCTHAPSRQAKLINKEILISVRTKVYGPVETCRKWRERVSGNGFRGINLSAPQVKPFVLKRPAGEPEISPVVSQPLSLRALPVPQVAEQDAPPVPEMLMPADITVASPAKRTLAEAQVNLAAVEAWKILGLGVVEPIAYGTATFPKDSPVERVIPDQERANAIRKAKEIEKRLAEAEREKRQQTGIDVSGGKLSLVDFNRAMSEIESAARAQAIADMIKQEQEQGRRNYIKEEIAASISEAESKRQGEIMAIRAANEALQNMTRSELREIDRDEYAAIVKRVAQASGRPPEEIGGIIENAILRDRQVAERVDKSTALKRFRVSGYRI